MSLSGALSAAVSGLRAQSAQMAAVGENIANASTVAYKTRGVDFRSLVVGNSTRSGISGGGVLFSTSQNIKSQGLIQATSSSTDVAINGQGFFVVSDDLANQPSGYTYSRNGNFRTDDQGFLINTEGYYLMGQRTDDTGAVTALNSNDLNSVEPINVNAISGTAQATSIARFDLNLPADAPIFDPLNPGAGGQYRNSFEINDSLGVSHSVQVEWTKTGINQWSASYSDPVQANTNPAVTTGALTNNNIDITFNGDGSIASFNPDPPELEITWANGATAPQTVALDLGTVGLKDGVTQQASNTATPDMEIFLIDQDGVRFGQLSGVDIDNSGLVTAFFENGVRLPVYQIPVATFPNPNGLIQVNGSIYDEAETAGNLNLRRPGQGSAGEILANSLELSTTDTSEEFNKMIVSQQAYSSAAQVVSTADELFDELIAAVR
ncbi:MAG: flagellar hook protein FlgE [Micavibrio sp.]|nr:flagellar hook protein FlgE [Micavibrio sp.]